MCVDNVWIVQVVDVCVGEDLCICFELYGFIFGECVWVDEFWGQIFDDIQYGLVFVYKFLRMQVGVVCRQVDEFEDVVVVVVGIFFCQLFGYVFGFCEGVFLEGLVGVVVEVVSVYVWWY